MKYYIYIKDILGVQTDLANFAWRYGKAAPEATADAYRKCLIRVCINMTADHAVFSPADIARCDAAFQYFRVNTKENILFYERELPFDQKLRYALQVRGNHLQVTVGHSYLRLVRLRIMNIHPIGDILADIVTELLLKNGYAPLYCASCYLPQMQTSVALFSAPAVGKTTTCLALCKQHGALFLSEDVTLTDGKCLFSVPWTSSVRRRKSRKRGSLDLREKASPAKELAKCDKAKIDRLLVLERGERVFHRDKNEILRKIRTLDRYLFSYRSAPVLLVMQYFDLGVSLSDSEKKERDIQESMTSRAACHFLSLPHGEGFADAILSMLHAEAQKERKQ